jgi:hypothetical protein
LREVTDIIVREGEEDAEEAAALSTDADLKRNAEVFMASSTTVIVSRYSAAYMNRIIDIAHERGLV